MFEKQVGLGVLQNYQRDNFTFIPFSEILDLVQVTLGICPAGGVVVVVLFSL